MQIEQRPRTQLRVSDADRERVAELLRAAHAEGRLDLTEFDERVRQAWAARTYGDLDVLTTDLPTSTQPTPPPSATTTPAPHGGDEPSHNTGPGACGGGGRVGRAAVTAWLSASLINLVIWAIVSITVLHPVYPWWVWVAGPWGAILLVRWLSERPSRAG